MRVALTAVEDATRMYCIGPEGQSRMAKATVCMCSCLVKVHDTKLPSHRVLELECNGGHEVSQRVKVLTLLKASKIPLEFRRERSVLVIDNHVMYQ